MNVGQCGTETPTARPVGDSLDGCQRIGQRGDHQSALGLQTEVYVGEVHGHRAGCEVDHTGTTVGQDNDEPDHCDKSTSTEARGDLLSLVGVDQGYDQPDRQEGEQHRPYRAFTAPKHLRYFHCLDPLSRASGKVKSGPRPGSPRGSSPPRSLQAVPEIPRSWIAEARIGIDTREAKGPGLRPAYSM